VHPRLNRILYIYIYILYCQYNLFGLYVTMIQNILFFSYNILYILYIYIYLYPISSYISLQVSNVTFQTRWTCCSLCQLWLKAICNLGFVKLTVVFVSHIRNLWSLSYSSWQLVQWSRSLQPFPQSLVKSGLLSWKQVPSSCVLYLFLFLWRRLRTKDKRLLIDSNN